ncbi:TetR/AcrR family transcriptional regulator [Kutzneria sp. CA-103260]|uniref:TetR/AcrR family transcriptional regulator n=1 Tax=Kutzneria sp. CA-103260 TaxID=2802641 RepID=UPI001BAB7AC8|nr:TetR/AcrR family transcriptional regulator [Kutzneria sp. CA-103260]QUQ62857.1 transcriptional regulator [Kutzneria sp. CA-103260]
MRTYNSPRRKDAAEATRAAILEASRRLFVSEGYEKVTVADIAKAARVAVPTVYGSTGGKAAILEAVLKPAVEDPVVGQTLAAVAATDDPAEIIAAVAAGTRQNHERHWDLVWALYRHALAEPCAVALNNEARESYLAALAAVVDRLVALDALKLDRDEAVDVLWFYLGRPGWHIMVGDRGWDFDRAEVWLSAQARQALLRTPC